jgi:hypothetical protein
MWSGNIVLSFQKKVDYSILIGMIIDTAVLHEPSFRHILRFYPIIQRLITHISEKNIKFDEKFVNAWEHVDLEMQGCEKGFLPPFRTFICPADLGKCLKLIDNNISTISGKDNYNQRVTEGFTYFTQKWGKSVNDIAPVPMDEFYEKMKKITLKYAERAN